MKLAELVLRLNEYYQANPNADVEFAERDLHGRSRKFQSMSLSATMVRGKDGRGGTCGEPSVTITVNLYERVEPCR